MHTQVSQCHNKTVHVRYNTLYLHTKLITEVAEETYKSCLFMVFMVYPLECNKRQCVHQKTISKHQIHSKSP